jgi:hypothetical protein
MSLSHGIAQECWPVQHVPAVHVMVLCADAPCCLEGYAAVAAETENDNPIAGAEHMSPRRGSDAELSQMMPTSGFDEVVLAVDFRLHDQQQTDGVLTMSYIVASGGQPGLTGSGQLARCVCV